MPLTIKSLNGDTNFLLTFSPPSTSVSSHSLFPGSFTILIDPWLTGSATILSPLFSISERKGSPCIKSLKELDQEPDLILISQDKPDHCHEDTLRQLPRECQSTILAAPAAAKKIRSWKHFPSQLVQTLPEYVEGDAKSLYRIVLPPSSPRGSCGEVTVTLISAKRDISGLHNGIGITYRPPCTATSVNSTSYIDLPISPPPTPRSLIAIASSPRTIVPSPYNDREKTMSVIYSPHGAPYDTVRPYASSHLVAESALPLTALIHSFDRVDNPWYLGGNISTGSPGGLQIAQNLFAQAWISAHDADKNNRGISVQKVQILKYTPDKIREMLLKDSDKNKKKSNHINEIQIVTLASGQEYSTARG
ncbi:hypothetical protein GQ43DRAFT_441045 [Delitschia confertaspora ATCC 74209]|uniref:Uncharacterized protein n=1 Tax=Delitschia confertaspora ATCC 74209 TaxID=1513339 RepID=A0A9P4JPM7_9PLEO|nr:hypothetical protein GQ43DRAFT_441045 [Delitschia confertaspora ATCC 74209]